MNKIYIVDLEDVETRYTGEWKSHLPRILGERVNNFQVETIEGNNNKSTATDGAFLNFSETNRYKNDQMNKIATLFTEGKIKDGDKFLFTDFWHNGVIQLRYQASLLGVDVEIHGLAHAGSYDKWDFLGRHFDKNWSYPFERSLYYAYDKVWFATEFHKQMFLDVLELGDASHCGLTGWPMEYMHDLLSKYKDATKENIVVFPHRIAPEKQPDIIIEIEKQMPDYEFVYCQSKSLTKSENHRILSKSKLMISTALQVTLGITGYEGLCLGVIPMVPDRLSYTEMYSEEFKYPSNWSDNYENADIKSLVSRAKYYLENYESISKNLDKERERLLVNFFSADNLYNNLNTL